MSMRNMRTIIIGLDGVPFYLLKDLAERGIIPKTREILSASDAFLGKMQSSLPEVSSVAWSSIITGKNPAEHGIFGFTDLLPHSYELTFPCFNDLQSPPFWNLIKGKSVIVNVPSTYPVKEMNGVHISGFVSIDFNQSVFPKSLIPILKKFDYRLDVDSTLAHQSMDLFLDDLDKTLPGSIQTYRYLWENIDWEIFMFVFTGTDRLMHFLWEAYEKESHKFHGQFLEYFRKIDQVIGEIGSRIKEEDRLIMLSDHGFEKLDYDVYINALLKKEGYLHFGNKKDHSLIRIDSSTKAFALDPARIYIHTKEKYPNGRVDRRDREKIIQDLKELFSDLEIDKRRVIKDIYTKEDIYSGPFMDRAPDIILVGDRGFNLKGNMKQEKLTDKDIFTGKHTQENAFFLMKGRMEKDIIPNFLTVFDVKDLIMRQIGA